MTIAVAVPAHIARPTDRPRQVAIWLFVCAGLIFAMAVIGAITRLTESGLSMVEWKPLIQTVPPLSAAEWQRVYDLYRATPEYRLVHTGMTLAEFQQIFFWEWLHRLWGHLIGIAYLVPFLVLLARRAVPRHAIRPLVGLFVLGGLQGVVGWFMVASGLNERPSVSHYRLAMHLLLALLIFALTVWTARGLWAPRPVRDAAAARTRPPAIAALCALSLTLLWGAFTAGLDAGLVYNSFPLMGGGLAPPDLLAMQPAWINFVENHGAVQFTHRMLAYTTAALVIWTALRARAAGAAPRLARFSRGAIHVVLLQIILGIATVLMQVPTWLGALHQANAILLLTVLVLVLFETGTGGSVKNL